MTITEAVAEVYEQATGKTTVLTSGSKYTRIIGLLKRYQRRWARTPGIDWNSLYDPAFSIGTVSATDTYDLDKSTVRKLSDRIGDSVRIVWTDGVGYTDFTIVAHDKLKSYSAGVNKQTGLGFYCAQIGSELVFNHVFASTDAQYGGEIFVPCYGYPDDITSANPDSDEIQVDDPEWLTCIAAAQYCRNDITRRQRWGELLGEANEIMERMKDDNGGQVEDVDRPWTPFSGIGNNASGNNDPWS